MREAAGFRRKLVKAGQRAIEEGRRGHERKAG
jgi:hypothetical protein